MTTKNNRWMFLIVALEKILAEKDIKRKEHLQLKKACETTIGELKAHASEDDSSSSDDATLKADSYFLSLELACKAKSTRIVTTALDCIQKLVAYGHISGKRVDSTNPNRLLIDRVIESVCDSFTGPGADEAVLLQIIKALLAAVLSVHCDVHDSSLLFAIRTCFTIYLTTKDPINAATAKGALTHIIKTVFERMEKHAGEKDISVHVDELVRYLIEAVVTEGDEQASIPDSRPRSDVGGDSESLQIANPSDKSFSNVYEKDAFLCFRALCALAQKDEGDTTDPNEDDAPIASLLSFNQEIFMHSHYKKCSVSNYSGMAAHDIV